MSKRISNLSSNLSSNLLKAELCCISPFYHLVEHYISVSPLKIFSVLTLQNISVSLHSVAYNGIMLCTYYDFFHLSITKY